MDNKLEERLRARLIRDRGHRGPLFEYKADPLCAEAADEITRLNAENEELRKALGEANGAIGVCVASFEQGTLTLGGMAVIHMLKEAQTRYAALLAQPPVSHDQ